LIAPGPLGRIRLQSLLAALVLASLVPLTAFAIAQVYSASNRQRAQVDRQNIETARAISVAVDQRVENSIDTLTALATLDAVDLPDAAGFLEMCRRVIPRQNGWHGILLADPDGRVVVNSIAITQTAAEALPAVDWVDAVVQSRRPAVSNLVESPGVNGHFVIVAVPVVRHGDVKFVLGVQLRLEGLNEILRQQQTPPNGVVTLIDGNKRIIARTRGGPGLVGRLPSAGFQAVVDRMREGSWRDVTLEGTTAYAAMSRSALTGWTVGVGLPSDDIDIPIRRSVLASAALGLTMLVVAGGASLLLGRYLVGALSSAAASSMALARGEPLTLRSSRIAEVDALSSGLRAAADTVRSRIAGEETARREAESANRLKDEFLMTVSHELRTPLTAIQGWAGMLKTGQLRDERRTHAVEVIARNAAALTALVEDLLDVSRAISGKMRLELQPLDVTPVVLAAVQTVEPVALAKDIRVRTIAGTSGIVAGDRNRLQQVVWNLLSNAVKFTPVGGSIAVSVSVHADGVEIAVCDNGPGIDPDFLPFVFERFRQGRTGDTRAQGGLGLGLAISRHLVELHGGTIRAENNREAPGSTFVVRLPVIPHVIGSLSDVARHGDAAARLEGVRVLLVDDDPTAREQYCEALERAGAEVRSASSASDALAVLQRWDATVVVADVEMPNPDGGALMAALARSTGSGAPIPAIGLTGHGRELEHERGLPTGFQLHLRKPVEPDALLTAISTLVV
jgi:signal transduction histidine kinase